MHDFREVLKARGKENCIVRRGIIIGDFVLSIQASSFHKCTPEKNLPIMQYTEMELCLYRNHIPVDIENDEFFKDWEFKDQMEQYHDIDFYNFVPVEILQSLYEYVTRKENKTKKIEW